MFSGKSKFEGRPGGGATLSFIGAETEVTGDIATTAHLQLDGAVTGDISCDVLTQGASGRLTGNIRAQSVQLAGLVDGTVEAASVTLDASARVTGDISYEAVTIATGAQVDGRLKRRGGAEAGKKPEPLALTAQIEPEAPAKDLLAGTEGKQPEPAL